MASLTRWTWVWAFSGSWWWTGKPDVLQSMGSQRVVHDWATELTEAWLWWGHFFYHIFYIKRSEIVLNLPNSKFPKDNRKLVVSSWACFPSGCLVKSCVQVWLMVFRQLFPCFLLKDPNLTSFHGFLFFLLSFFWTIVFLICCHWNFIYCSVAWKTVLLLINNDFILTLSELFSLIFI